MFCEENITHFLMKKYGTSMYSQNNISETTTTDNMSWLLNYKIIIIEPISFYIRTYEGSMVEWSDH